MLDGQEIHIVESFIGILEVLIPDAVCDRCSASFDDVDALTYYKADGTTAMTTWTYDDLCTQFKESNMHG